MFSLEFDGEFPKAKSYLKRLSSKNLTGILSKYGNIGVEALAKATPVDSSKTAQSWSYEVETSKSGVKIEWINTNVNNGVNIAVIIQTGHGTRTGGYVQGRDYINPAMRPVFDQITEELWREVTK